MEKIAIIVPAYNEEQVISRTLIRLTQLVDPKHIYVISDASTDNTGKIVKTFKVNYTRTRTNNGKVKNLEKVLTKFRILNRYQYVSIIDADSIPDFQYYKQILPHFKKPDIACVCGQIKSELKPNLFVIYRALMYYIWQNIYKRLSSYLNVITIAPGTASVYRSSVLRHLDFDPKIIIEDFDMTFQVHRKRLGKIIYEPNAIVTTQDPDNLWDTLKQVTRWQLGFLQTAVKHRVPFKFQPLDIALILFTFQGIIHAIFLTTLIPLVMWLYFLALYPSILGFYFYPHVYYRLYLVEVIYLGTFLLFFILKSHPKFIYLKYIPIAWTVSLVYIVAFYRASYQLIFRSIHGAWQSPTRR